MGFNSVYGALQEIFREVDSRILRAVAIEHSKDVDAAIDSVIMEVIPYLSKHSMAPPCSNGNEALVPSGGSACLEDKLNVSSCYNTNACHGQVCGSNGALGKSKESRISPNIVSHISSNSSTHESDTSGNYDQEFGNTESEGIILVQNHQENCVNAGSNHCSRVSLNSFTHVDGSTLRSINSNVYAEREDFDGHSANDFSAAIYGESHQEESRLDANPLEEENSLAQLASSFAQECELISSVSGFQSVVLPHLSITDNEKTVLSGSAASGKDTFTSEMIDLENESILNTSVARSGQICSIDLVEDTMEAARSNKKTLFLAMESVINLMREVENQEKAAERTKEEAARGGFDILTRVEDLKELLPRAKEANDMNAGEIYAERAILDTEVRELQCRLISLSADRDKSLAILDEMRQKLEVRLAAAEKDKEAAENEKLEKEESAKNALAKQELAMEKVVEESKILEQEAEENSKLREFLMDRGHIVDVLQGEISVICHDVKLLKEKLDKRVPCSESLFSDQTSCRLAYSSSVLKGMATDQVPEQADSSESPKKTSSTSTVSNHLLSQERAGDDHKALADEGWDFFDSNELPCEPCIA